MGGFGTRAIRSGLPRDAGTGALVEPVSKSREIWKNAKLKGFYPDIPYHYLCLASCGNSHGLLYLQPLSKPEPGKLREGYR
jgi:hypothetical protein